MLLEREGKVGVPRNFNKSRNSVPPLKNPEYFGVLEQIRIKKRRQKEEVKTSLDQS